MMNLDFLDWVDIYKFFTFIPGHGSILEWHMIFNQLRENGYAKPYTTSSILIEGFNASFQDLPKLMGKHVLYSSIVAYRLSEGR